MLKGCLSISGEERTILEKIRRKFGIFLSPHEIVNKLFSAEKKTSSGDPYYNDGTMGMMQRPKRLLSILTTCKTCFLSIKEHLLNLLLKEIIYKKGKRRLESNCVVYVPRENSILLSFHPSKKVFSIGLYLVGKRQENLSKEAKKIARPPLHVAAFHNEGPTFFWLEGKACPSNLSHLCHLPAVGTVEVSRSDQIELGIDPVDALHHQV